MRISIISNMSVTRWSSFWDSRTTNLKAGCGGSWVNRSSEIEDVPRAEQAPSRQQMDHSQWKQKVLPCLLFPVDLHTPSHHLLPSPCCSICLGSSLEDRQELLMLPDVFHYTTVLHNNWLWWQPCETGLSCRICNIATKTTAGAHFITHTGHRGAAYKSSDRHGNTSTAECSFRSLLLLFLLLPFASHLYCYQCVCTAHAVYPKVLFRRRPGTFPFRFCLCRTTHQ